MTVQAAATPVADVDRDAVEQQFTEFYREHWKRVQRYIWRRLDLSQEAVSEDLAQKVFLTLWESYYAAGKDVEAPLNLVYAIARGTISSYVSKKKNHELALDLGDPVNTPIVATGHAYAPYTPHLAGIGRELEAAMERMQSASKAWRDADKALHRLRATLDDETSVNCGGLSEATRERTQKQLQDVTRQEPIRLGEFRTACAEVGRLRAALEDAGGANWSSVSGMPASAGTRPRLQGSPRSDPTITHCANGHELTRQNTYFHADGDRECRTCKSLRNRPRVRSRPAGQRRRTDTVSDAVLEQARQMLADPANVRVRIADIAKQCGMAQSTLNLRLGGEVQRLRQAARDSAGAVR